MVTAAAPESSVAACVHVWDIALANGHTSPGTCRKCSETRDFLNSCDEILAAGASYRTLDFRVPEKTKEVSVAKPDIHKRHKEIEKRWPEIRKAIEETGSVNKAAELLGFSYSAIRTAAGRHGLDCAEYTRRIVPGKAVARKEPEAARAKANGAKPSDNIGEALIGVGLVIIGAWLKSREG
jgi:hypothetical protein